MFIQKEQFKKEIYKYCDKNVGGSCLFLGFTHLWFSKKEKITPKDLAFLTSKIINDLIGKKVLVEIPKKFENVYGMYKILPHEKLIKKNKLKY